MEVIEDAYLSKYEGIEDFDIDNFYFNCPKIQ